jgi:putative SOS response-associated peptidase YedK
MCGRYKIDEHWQEYCQNPFFDWNDPPFPTENPFRVYSDEVFPRERMPIVRLNESGKMIAELRQWGFIMMMKGKTLDSNGKPKLIRRDVFNAMSEKLATGFPLALCVRGITVPDPDVELG